MGSVFHVIKGEQLYSAASEAQRELNFLSISHQQDFQRIKGVISARQILSTSSRCPRRANSAYWAYHWEGRLRKANHSALLPFLCPSSIRLSLISICTGWGSYFPTLDASAVSKHPKKRGHVPHWMAVQSQIIKPPPNSFLNKFLFTTTSPSFSLLFMLSPLGYATSRFSCLPASLPSLKGCAFPAQWLAEETQWIVTSSQHSWSTLTRNCSPSLNPLSSNCLACTPFLFCRREAPKGGGGPYPLLLPSAKQHPV